jgi:uncharacterized protein with PIN domain
MSDQIRDSTETRYERCFRGLLWRLHPRRLQSHVRRVMALAARNCGLDISAWDTLHAAVRERVIRRLVARRMRTRTASGHGIDADAGLAEVRFRTMLDGSISRTVADDSPDFHCDGGLGGLARWLRAAGYDAQFWPQVDDGELIRAVLRSDAILITTDGPLMERGVIARGVVPALLAPLSAGKHGQFEFVMRTLGLPRKTPRCMACGGSLNSVDKEAVRDRIPVRTYPWLDDYYVCNRCGKLFWHGTHWARVEQRLEPRTKESGVRSLESGGPENRV